MIVITWVTIHLSGLPGIIRRAAGFLLDLAPGGACKPRKSPCMLVRSYRTVSALPVNSGAKPSAVCFLLHFPSPRDAWFSPSTLPYGVPTFLNLPHLYR